MGKFRATIQKVSNSKAGQTSEGVDLNREDMKIDDRDLDIKLDGEFDVQSGFKSQKFDPVLMETQLGYDVTTPELTEEDLENFCLGNENQDVLDPFAKLILHSEIISKISELVDRIELMKEIREGDALPERESGKLVGEVDLVSKVSEWADRRELMKEIREGDALLDREWITPLGEDSLPSSDATDLV